MRHLAPPRTAAALLLCCSLLLAAAAAVLGLAPSAHAEDPLGKLTLPVTSGKIADNPTFPKVTTDGPCPSTNAQQVSLVLVKPTGTVTLGKTTVGAPFDQGPFSADILAGKSLESQLLSWIPTGPLDGTYDIGLVCRTAGNVGSKYFAVKVNVTGDSWTLEAPAAAATTTTLTAAPAATAPAGAEVTLTAAVMPAAAAGKVTFLDGATALGTIDAASGTAALKTTALTQGAHTLTASFAPADTAAYAASVSTAAAYTVTAAGSPSPDPSDTGSPTPTAPTDLDATDEDGTALDVNPTLTAGQQVLLTARGYTKDAKVKVALADSEAAFPDATADAQGTVTAYAFTVPADSEDGSYILSLTEDKAEGHSVEFMYSIGDAPDPGPSDSATADDGGTTGGADGGDSGSAGTGGGDGSTGGGETATGPLASTGTSALALGAAALALCGLGTAFVMHARRKGLLRF
ncbi:Ig-like domain-containing protein [Streptomyces sp. NBC_01022]|uniref:Ig-like domain-containing protein n=1 Tax=Streptomyces sp. NBC_01022 TaxID=2903723 RepID=UPI002DD7D108|nr:Ig-like domain-containing protein [Streptomyces sp. NBC_01022]WRZ83995.1 Ig-like domain-containing protein [Streptomyces sp. NBC_01022]